MGPTTGIDMRYKKKVSQQTADRLVYGANPASDSNRNMYKKIIAGAPQLVHTHAVYIQSDEEVMGMSLEDWIKNYPIMLFKALMSYSHTFFVEVHTGVKISLKLSKLNYNRLKNRVEELDPELLEQAQKRRSQKLYLLKKAKEEKFKRLMRKKKK
jgi:hypothetical protein